MTFEYQPHSDSVCGIQAPWGASALKILRIVGSYILFFFACMVVVVTTMQGLPDGVQMLFAFVMPALLVWWRERRRSEKLALTRQTEEVRSSRHHHDGEQAPGFASSATLPGLPGGAPLGQPHKFASRAAQSSPTYQPRQDNGELIPAGRAARSELEAAALRREIAKPKSSRRASLQGWLPKGETAIVAGRVIDGMVYIGTPPRTDSHVYGEKCRPYIDPSLTVASVGTDKRGDGMPYWPGYSSIPAICRATYLDWLADGRSDGSVNPGYMFLYFYGLERRFILDDPPIDEKHAILEESRRLFSLFSDSGSVRRYLGEFIQIAEMSLNVDQFHQPVFETSGWELPLSVKVIIGAKIGKGDALPSEWLLSWFLCHPERQLRTSAIRCSGEFRELFRLRFQRRFPEGLKVKRPNKVLSGTYRAASGEFQGTLSPTLNNEPVPDISGLRAPIGIAQTIANYVMDDLDKFSRYLGRNPSGRGSLEGHALLPSELWDLFPSDEMEGLRAWAKEKVVGGGLVPAVDVIARLEGTRPEKVGHRQLTGAADALARLGYGLAPDPRFSLRGPKSNEPVVIFELGEVIDQLEDVSSAYRVALFEIALATFIAHADSRIVEAERKSLRAKIEGAGGVSDQERKRLHASLDWYLAVPSDMALLRGKLKEADAEHHIAIRAAVVSIAHADSIIHSDEVACIEKVYMALGLDPGLVYSDLHAGDIPDGPVRVKPAEADAPGEKIPAEASAKSAPLDASRIAAIRSDTERVSSVLGQIFSVQDDFDGESSIASANTDLPVLKGLDKKHALLVREIVTREHWGEDAFIELTNKHGLMASGALEAINEWAFENFDEALLDEYDGYDVAPEIAGALNAEFVKEVQ
jgi:uncharacterized tellurite resistance protein B-like protein